MAVNEIYGLPSSWYTIPYTNDTMKIANFTNNAGSVDNARIAYAMQAGDVQPGTLIDSSVCTHAIPSTLEGHPWNTMFDVGGINVKGGSENCVLNKHYGNAPGIIYRVNARSSGSTSTSLAPYLNSPQSYNSPQTNVSDNWDVYRMCPVTQIDFKRFVFAIVLQVCTAFETETDSEGIKRRTDSTSVPSYIMIDLQTWLSDMAYSSTETFHDHFPHICSVHLVPLYQRYGSEIVWNNFTLLVDASHRLACIPNMNFDYTCSGWNQSTSRCTAENTGTPVLTNAVTWMDNQPISSQSVRYMMNETQTNTMNIGDSPCTLFTIFGMNGGNGTSSGIVVNCDINSNNNRYQVRTVRGFSHLDWAYVGSESSSSRQLFAWWKDQPEKPIVVDPSNPTPAETAALIAWKATIASDIHKMVAYTGAVFQDSANGYNLNPEERYIGEIDTNGIATGNVMIITEDTFSDFPQTASDNFIDDTPYDPSYNPESETSDPYDYPDRWRTGFGLFDHAYLLNNAQVEALSDWFNDCTNYALHPPEGVDPEAILEEYKNAADGESPINAVISLMSFPLAGDVLYSNLVSDSSLHYLHLGTLMTNQVMGADVETAAKPQGYKIQLGNGVIRLMGMSVPWSPYYNDFRDYAPYTTAELVVPFHGSTQLDAADWLGHEIGIDYVIDIRTGTSTALIKRDGIPVKTLDGMVGVPIPMSGTDAAGMINTQQQNAYNVRSAEIQKTSAIANAIFGTAQGFASGASGVAKNTQGVKMTNNARLGSMIAGGAIGAAQNAVNGVIGVKSADLSLSRAKSELDHIPVSRMTVGSANSSCSVAMELKPRLNIHRCRMVTGYDEASFGHTSGFACKLNGSVGSFNGYTECGDVDCSGIVGATEEEKNMIRDALVSGTYL